MRYLSIIALMFLLFACNPAKETPDKAVNYDSLRLDSIHKANTQRYAQTYIESGENIRKIIESRIPGERYKAFGIELYSSVLLPKTYIENSFSPLWITSYDSLTKVQEMVNFVRDTEYHGLVPDHYHYQELYARLESLINDSDHLYDPVFIANFDLLLTDAYFMIASHLYHGKVDPESLEAQWGIRRDKPDLPLDARLKYMLKHETVEEGFRHFYPPNPGYAGMVEEYKKLKSLIDKDFSINVQLKSGPIKPGDSLADVAEIKKKLTFWNLYSPDTTSHPGKYDEKSVEAMKKLQHQFGYNTDGIIGKNAVKALNLGVKERIDLLAVNMERLRWMPDSLEPVYILVNIADFTLQVFRGSDTLMSMRTIVGKDYRETPVFNALITYLVLSPSWTVPPTIQRQDVIPAVARNAGYLASKNMKVYDSKGKLVDPASVNWKRDGMRYTIRQSPGAQNALGKVKFMFPNKHNVYLHDTPSRELFARDERTFSSGCIRIEKPMELAQLLLSDMDGWSPEKVKQAMNSSSEKTVVLKSPAGVYLYYLTAWADSKGIIHYRSDIYNRDKEMLIALREKHKKWNT